jgi:hypothetical protein
MELRVQSKEELKIIRVAVARLLKNTRMNMKQEFAAIQVLQKIKING